MKIKQNLLLTATTLGLVMSASSYAGRQGVSAYYGVGLGLISPDYKTSATVNGPDDATMQGAIVAGVEEDGWALEAVAFSGLEAGTNSSVDYTMSGLDIGLAYRTIEKNSKYYKLKFSKSDVDIDFTQGLSTAETEGNTYSIGMGFRMDRQERMEINYNLFKPDEGSDTAHMINVSYLWGGAPYDGEYHSWDDNDRRRAGPLNIGLYVGQLDLDFGLGFENATVYGLATSFDLAKHGSNDILVEFTYGVSGEASSDDSIIPDEYTTSSMALFAAYRTSGPVYFKGRLGYMQVSLEQDFYIPDAGSPTGFTLDATAEDDESGFAYGLGGGMMFGNYRLELDYTVVKLETAGFKYDPSAITVSLLYNF